MGAQEFQIVATGSDPEQAFKDAIEQCLYTHGHSGYTGTIAEKDTYTMASLKLLSELEAQKLIQATINTTYFRKNGPAGCIQIKTSNKNVNTYIFYGWASC